MPLPYSFSYLSSINHLSLFSLPLALPLWYLLSFTVFPSPHAFLYFGYHFSILSHTLSSLLCPSPRLAPFWSFLCLPKAASSPPVFYLFLSQAYKYREAWRVWGKQTKTKPALLWNTGSSLFNYTYQDQLYSWITWFHKTCSLFPSVPSQFSLWKHCFARCPVTHLYLWGKLPVALKNNIQPQSQNIWDRLKHK